VPSCANMRHDGAGNPGREEEPGRTFGDVDPGALPRTLVGPVAIDRSYAHFAGNHLYTLAIGTVWMCRT
jgi:hypothetical protein